MQPLSAARNQGLARAAIGAAMLAAPAAVNRGWVGEDAERPGAQLLSRALGAREIALGLGQAQAARAGFGVRPWLLGGVVSDAADFVGTVQGRDRLPRLGAIAIGFVAASSAVAGLWLARALD